MLFVVGIHTFTDMHAFERSEHVDVSKKAHSQAQRLEKLALVFTGLPGAACVGPQSHERDRARWGVQTCHRERLSGAQTDLLAIAGR